MSLSAERLQQIDASGFAKWYEAASRLAILVLERLETVPDGWTGDEHIGPVERELLIAEAKRVLGEKP